MDGDPVKKRRTRAVNSCLPCRRRKIKCDRGTPCKSCINAREEHLCVVSQSSLGVRYNEKRSCEKYVPSNDKVAKIDDTERDPDFPYIPPWKKKMSFPVGILAYLDARGDRVVERLLDAPGSSKADSEQKDGESSRMSWSPRVSLVVPQIENAKRRKLLLEAYDTLPSFPITDGAIDRYLNDFNWMSALIDENLFKKTYDAFKDMLASGDYPYYQVDPAFVSQILIMVATVAQVQLSPEELFGHPVSEQVRDSLIVALYEASKKALECAEWQKAPTIRSIQASCLISDFVAFYYEQDSIVNESYITLAYHQCFRLGYHDDSWEGASRYPADRAVPPQNRLLNREIRRRVLLNVFLRYKTQTESGIEGVIENTIYIPLPLNCSLNEITEHSDPSELEKPLSTVTDSVWLDLFKFEFYKMKFPVKTSTENPLSVIDMQQRIIETCQTFVKIEKEPPMTKVGSLGAFAGNELSVYHYLHLDLNAPQLSSRQRLVRTFAVQIIAQSFMSAFKDYFELNMRNGEHPRLAMKTIEAARLVLECENILLNSLSMRTCINICNVRRALVIIFMAFLMSGAQEERLSGRAPAAFPESTESYMALFLQPNHLKVDLEQVTNLSKHFDLLATMCDSTLFAERKEVIQSTLQILNHVKLCLSAKFQVALDIKLQERMLDLLKSRDPIYRTQPIKQYTEAPHSITLDDLTGFSSDFLFDIPDSWFEQEILKLSEMLCDSSSIPDFPFQSNSLQPSSREPTDSLPDILSSHPVGKKRKSKK